MGTIPRTAFFARPHQSTRPTSSGPIRLVLVFFVSLMLLGAAVRPAYPSHNSQPSDPLFAASSNDLGQWGPRQIRADQAWHFSTGAGAVIGVVDSGVDLAHPDLAGKLLPGNTFLECPEAQANGCGTGSWTDQSRSVCGPLEDEPCDSGHGTHVAGTAAAATGNGLGVAGVAPDAKVLPVKVLDEAGGTMEDISQGVQWAVTQGSDVINLSLGIALGGLLPGSQVFNLTGDWDMLHSAIADAQSKGVVVVAAAGNESSPLCADPAFASGALCVTATDSKQGRPAYSNHPINEELLAVAAPGGGEADYAVVCGGGVLSTVPVGTGDSSIAGTCGYPNKEEMPDYLGYDEYLGTSMATPHVAGAAAILAAQGCSGDQVVNLLTGTARDPVTGARGSFSPVYGYGIVDAGEGASQAATICASGLPASVSMSPATGTRSVGELHAATASLKDGDGVAVGSTSVVFTVAGANRTSGKAVTDAFGKATFSYRGTSAGRDEIKAFAGPNGDGQRQASEPEGTATVDWVTPVVQGQPTLSIKDTSVWENSGLPATFTLTLSRSIEHPVLVRYALVDGSAKFANPQGPDYLRYTGQVMIPANALSTVFSVKIFNDNVDERPSEQFDAQLLAPLNAVLEEKTRGTATILDEDGS